MGLIKKKKYALGFQKHKLSITLKEKYTMLLVFGKPKLRHKKGIWKIGTELYLELYWANTLFWQNEYWCTDFCSISNLKRIFSKTLENLSFR